MTADVMGTPAHTTRRAARVAHMLGWTEGQLYTAAIGVAVALVLGVAGIPAAIRQPVVAPVADVLHRGRPPARGGLPASVAAPSTVGSAPALPATSSGAVGFDDSLFGAEASTASPPPGTITTFAMVAAPGAPGALALGSDGSVFVSTNNGTARGEPGPSHIFRYSAAGTLTSDAALTGQAAPHADGISAMAVAPDGHLLVVDADTGHVVSIDPGGHGQEIVATIPDVAPCVALVAPKPCEPGVVDHKPMPAAAAIDRAGNLFISDSGQGTIWRLGAGLHRVDAWYQSIDFATGDGPNGLGFAPDGRLDLTVGTSLDVANPNGGGLYAIAVQPDGSAGARTLVAKFALRDDPGALAVGSSGTAYVVLRGPNQIVAVAPNGATNVLVTAPGDGAIPLDGPAALAVANGELLVANQSAASTVSHWAVLAVSIEDGPAA